MSLAAAEALTPDIIDQAPAIVKTPPVLRAHRWTDNGALIADLANLGHLQADRLTLDPTFGKGVWWTRWQPTHLVAHNRAVDGHDFRAMPYLDGTFEQIAYDPPYVCVTPDTEILTRRGWRHYDELIVGEEILTLDHATGRSRWQPLQAVNVLPLAEREMLSMESPSHSSLTTLDHRWPVRRRRKVGGQRVTVPEWATSTTFTAEDSVPVRAPHAELPTAETHPDALVELVAWFWTEGTIERQRDGSAAGYGNIVQSHVANPEHCERIRAALTALWGPPTVGGFPRVGRATDGVPRWREAVDQHKAVFWLSSDAGRVLQAHAPERVPALPFILSLTERQLALFIDTSVAGDGHVYANGAITLVQKSREAADAFQFAAILAGYGSSIRAQVSPYGYTMWTVRLRTQATFKPTRTTREVAKVAGLVWCPTVADSTWLARRNGTVWFTGNCRGGIDTAGDELATTNERYGLHDEDLPRTPEALQHDLIDVGLAEMWRLAAPGARVLVKCQDYISSGHLWMGAYETWKAADKLGFLVLDYFDLLTTPRPQPHARQVHAAGNTTRLWVLRKPGRRPSAKKRAAVLTGALPGIAPPLPLYGPGHALHRMSVAR